MSSHKGASIVTTNTIKQKNEKDATRLNLKFNELDEMVDSQIVFEFGGPWGVTAMMIGFPILMYYLWGCLQFYRGRLESPFNEKLWTSIIQGSMPTFYAAKIYITFCVFEFFLAYTMPGPIVKGAPVSSLKGKQLDYLCNGVWSFYVTIFTSYLLHHYELFKLTDIIDNFGPLMSVAIIFGFLITFIIYAVTIFQGEQYRMSGYLMYDLFMGASLNPRIGKVILFYISVSAAIKEYEMFGYVSSSMAFMVLAHFLYVNACMKVPFTYCYSTLYLHISSVDNGHPITHSSFWTYFCYEYEMFGYVSSSMAFMFGFMLIFWNFAGVPFTYCYSTLYLHISSVDNGRPITHSSFWTYFCY
ncbi:4603_t:CDS:2, partial [Entrophospora sp. SA101]